MGKKENWWNSWFSEVKMWEMQCVDDCRDVWVIVYGIPVIAWYSKFFVSLAEEWGTFLCIDEKTAEGKVLDVARPMIKIPLLCCIPKYFSVNINGDEFKLVVREDNPRYFNFGPSNSKPLTSESCSSDSVDNSSEVDLEDNLEHRSVFSEDSFHVISSPVKSCRVDVKDGKGADDRLLFPNGYVSYSGAELSGDVSFTKSVKETEVEKGECSPVLFPLVLPNNNVMSVGSIKVTCSNFDDELDRNQNLNKDLSDGKVLDHVGEGNSVFRKLGGGIGVFNVNLNKEIE